MPRLFALLRATLGPWPGGADLPADARGEFSALCRERLFHHGRVLCAVVLGFTLLFWPLDPWAFQGAPEVRFAVDRWRVAVSLVSILYLLLPRRSWVVRRSFLLLNLWSTGACLAVGLCAGLMGGPERPFVHMLYVIVLGPVPLPLTLRQRVVGTLGVAVATCAGYFLPFPAHRASPFLPLVLIFMGFMTLLSVWFGHLLFLLWRENFQKTRELAQHSLHLEDEVAGKTEELRSLLSHVETAREADRALVSRELHDELGNELVALRYALDHARRRYRREPDAIEHNLDELDHMLQRTVEDTRNLIADLRPRVLDDLGLDAAVEWLVRRARARTGLSCDLRVHGETGDLPDSVRVAAFRILQECLTNVVRHAQAQRVEIEVSRDAAGPLTLLVRDDGVGIAPGARRGMGLLGMKERAAALGGRLDARPGQGGGTEVRCWLPATEVAS